MTADSLALNATRDNGLTAVDLHYVANLSMENTNPAPTLHRTTSRVSRPPISRRGLKPLFSSLQRRGTSNSTIGARLGSDWGKRKEKEWSGEWNLKDVKDVVKGLRELKGR